MSFFKRIFGNPTSESMVRFDEMIADVKSDDSDSIIGFLVLIFLPIKYFGIVENKPMKDVSGYTSDLALFELSCYISAKITFVRGTDPFTERKIKLLLYGMVGLLFKQLFSNSDDLFEVYHSRIAYYKKSFSELSEPQTDLFHLMINSVHDGKPLKSRSREDYISRNIRPLTSLPFTLCGVIVVWDNDYFSKNWLEAVDKFVEYAINQ
jgi:hypothetical protein